MVCCDEYCHLKFAESFVAGRLSAEVFAEAYIELWKIERDSDFLRLDPRPLNECLSSIFRAADMYNSYESREEYEFGDEMLKSEVARLIRRLSDCCLAGWCRKVHRESTGSSVILGGKQ
ncbi:colicin immunity domain-containing protein [Cupriavidus sp. UME77]|uniref:colicin immunity domain-containing protein n=1 Tax=Cupriavidus sp. UME77 TaxID=1862321 RepID=UPI0016020B7B|nr:colicin immunity domain-containing protein [Cupriavidus sp. UME77]